MNGLNGLNADRGRSPVVRFPATGGAGCRRGGRPTPQRTTARAGERPVRSGCRAATATAVSPATFDDANRTRARRPRSSAAPTPTPTPSSAPRRTFECAGRDSPCSGSFSRRSRSALAGHFALRSRRRGLTAFGFAVHGSLRSPLTLFETLPTVASHYAPSGTPASGASGRSDVARPRECARVVEASLRSASLCAVRDSREWSEREVGRRTTSGVRRPGIEPGLVAWEATVLPLDQRRATFR